MTAEGLLEAAFLEHVETACRTKDELASAVADIGVELARCLEQGGAVLWCGNGGSASDSQHIAAELVGRFKENRRPLRSVALSTDTSVLTCIGNDFGYDKIFSRQVEAVGRPGDVLVGISTSGQSPNVNEAFVSAGAIGLTTVGLLGKGGGEALGLVDHALVVPSDSTARIQEAHILIGHVFCEIIESELGLA